MIVRTFRKLQRLIVLQGFRQASLHLLKRLLRLSRGTFDVSRARLLHPFDLEHATDTSGMIKGVDLASGQRNDSENVAYYGVPPSIFDQVLAEWASTQAAGTVDEYTFVDLGAGKGRAVLLASELPFKEVIGVELNPKLAQTATMNISAWRAAGHGHGAMRIVADDAAAFPWPTGPLVVYLFNPFGAKVLVSAMEGLIASIVKDPRPADVLYIYPQFQKALMDIEPMKPLWSKIFTLSETDQAIDAYHVTSLQCNAYQIRTSANKAHTVKAGV